MKSLAIVAILALMIPIAGSASAQSNVTVSSADMVNGFMNVFNLPAPDGDGAYQFGSPWGFADLAGSFAGDVLTMGPAPINDPDPYWYIGGGGPGAQGNKIMEANGYAQADGPLSGVNVVFSGVVIDNTLTSDYSVIAFIRDFAPDFSSFVESSVPLGGPGPFSINLNTINDPARHVQYGFQMIGPNVWPTDANNFGSIVIGPEGTVSNDATSFGAVKSLY